ncbi:MAG: RNA polymerase sigma factor [Christensenellales bacterium]
MIYALLMTLENDDDRDFMLYIYDHYYDLMAKHALQIVQDRSLMEDMVHEAFVKLIKYIKKLRMLESYNLPSYLVYTMRSVCINYLNKSSTKREASGLQEDYMGEITDRVDHVEEQVLTAIDIEKLAECLSRLPEKDRNLLSFKYFLDMSDEEIASTMGIKQEYVRVYIHRARKKALHIMREGL